jgi:hypothetical protein
MTRPKLKCAECGKPPKECGYYLPEELISLSGSVDNYIWEHEVTLDKVSGQFLCDVCYMKLSCPAIIGSTWVASPENMKALKKYLFGNYWSSDV